VILQGVYEVDEKKPPREPRPDESTEYDDETVKWFIRFKGLRREDDDGPVLPPEYRLFNSQYPSYLAELERRKRAEEESQRRDAEARAVMQKAYEHKQRMRDMREWGRENGYFVGTRGRIPRRVVEAYNEAKGIQ
jgi:hypothetical protein